MTIPWQTKIWGVLLFCLGSWFLYASMLAIYGYFDTGVISWGRRINRRATGETALLFHAIFCLAGGAMAAKGIQQFVYGDSRA